MEDIELIREKNAPIAVFDSGLGGVSVLKEMIKIMPEEDMYYFGDSQVLLTEPRAWRKSEA